MGIAEFKPKTHLPQSSIAPPHSLEAERAILGGCLRDPATVTTVLELLQEDHFFVDLHRAIFSVFVERDSQGEPIDIVTVADGLKRKNYSEVDSALGYLIELTENAPISQNIPYHAKIIADYFYLRKIIDVCQSTIGKASQLQGSATGFVEDLEREVLAIFNAQDRGKGIVAAAQVLEDTIVELEEKLLKGGGPSGVPSGFMDLDAITGGFQRSDLIILAARPGMGKTALALNVAVSAVKKKFPTIVFSLEMSKNQLMMRLLASESRVDSSRIVKGELNEDERNRLMHGARTIGTLESMLGIDETSGITLAELRSRARRFKKEFGLGLIVVDYLQLMGSTSTRKSDNREREIAEFSSGLKSLAKELNVPVIALAQLNRGPDNRTDKRPKTADLRESGSLEQDADLILFVYRDEYYNKMSEDAGKAEVIIAKNRHGPQDTVMLAFQSHYVTFHNLMR